MTVFLANVSKLSLRTTVWHHICLMLLENHEATKNVFIFIYTNKVKKNVHTVVLPKKNINMLSFKRKLWEMVFSVLCPHLGLPTQPRNNSPLSTLLIFLLGKSSNMALFPLFEQGNVTYFKFLLAQFKDQNRN